MHRLDGPTGGLISHRAKFDSWVCDLSACTTGENRYIVTWGTQPGEIKGILGGVHLVRHYCLKRQDDDPAFEMHYPTDPYGDDKEARRVAIVLGIIMVTAAFLVWY